MYPWWVKTSKSGCQKAILARFLFAQGFETMLFIALILMFPSGFQVFALVFGILCWITTAQRIRLSYRYLSEPGRGR